MIFRAPQIIYICLMVFSLAIDIERHGKPKTGNHNAWAGLLGAALGSTLLWWGGFFGVTP